MRHNAVMQVLPRPLHQRVLYGSARCARNLLRFAETETDVGRDLVRAAELSPDPLLRMLLLIQARDEERRDTAPPARPGSPPTRSLLSLELTSEPTGRRLRDMTEYLQPVQDSDPAAQF